MWTCSLRKTHQPWRYLRESSIPLETIIVVKGLLPAISRTLLTFGAIKSSKASAICHPHQQITTNQTGRGVYLVSTKPGSERGAEWISCSLSCHLYSGVLSQINIWKAHRVSFGSDGGRGLLWMRVTVKNTTGLKFQWVSALTLAPCILLQNTNAKPGFSFGVYCQNSSILIIIICLWNINNKN